MLKQLLLIPILLSVLLYSSSADCYATALKLYEEASYTEAYPEIQAQAKKGNKEAQYLLAYMYEEGLGTKQNSAQAIYWYKKSASRYSYTTEKSPYISEHNASTFSQRIKNQMKYTSEEKGGHFAFSKIDTKTPEVKSRLLKMLENNFGLLPYNTNFIAPLTYSSTSY